jgi:hypothetical protein
MIRFATAAGIAMLSVLPGTGWAQAPARDGNESDFKDWQPTRGGVAVQERAAGIRQTPEQRNAEDRELQDLSKTLLNQEKPSTPPGN